MTNSPTSPRSQIVIGFLSLSSAEILCKLIMLAAFAFIARVVGPAGFGYLEFASSVVLCGGFIVDQGFGIYGAREIARSPSSTPSLVTQVASVRIVLAAVVYAGLAWFASALDRPPVVKDLLLLYGLSLLFMPFMLQWVFQGHDRMRVVALMQVARTGIFAIAVFALLREGGHLWPVAIAEVFGSAAVVLVSIWFYRTQLGLPIRLRFAASMELLRSGSTIGLGQLFWSLRMYGATIVMGMIASEDDVGFFGAAMRLAIACSTFVWLYFANLLPSMSRTWHHDLAAFRALMGTSIRTAVWLALGGGILWVFLAPAVIQVAYGPEFIPATSTLRWMSGLCILGAIHGHFRFGLIAAEYQRFATVAAGLGTLIALALIPLGYAQWGISGAAIALLVGEAAVWGSSFLFSQSLLRLERPMRHFTRPLLAAAVLLAMQWAMPLTTPVIARLAVAVIGFALSLFVAESQFRAAIARRLKR